LNFLVAFGPDRSYRVLTIVEGLSRVSIHITPELMEISYERLRLTRPFRRWKLPHADEVIFMVTNKDGEYGEFCFDTVRAKSKPTIKVSCVMVRSLDKLDETMAHEMGHFYEYRQGRRSDVHHGRSFQKIADQICAAHGFRRGTF